MSLGTNGIVNSSAYEPQKLNHRHEGVALWLVANPSGTLTECAGELGYTVAWVSRLVASDMFQAYYKELCRERNEPVVHSIGEKMSHVAHLALDRMQERLLPGGGASDGLVLNAADKLLTKLGYAGEPVAPTRHEHLHLHGQLTPEDLEAARASREAMRARARELATA